MTTKAGKSARGATTTPRKAPDYWDKAAERVLVIELNKRGMQPEDLAPHLEKLGFDETNAKNLKQRIGRGAFGFNFALRALRMLKVRTLDISYLEVRTRKGQVIKGDDLS